jgi:hemerythrin-like domain-containing protein/quercetin dioxygenase-like cupin family protein
MQVCESLIREHREMEGFLDLLEKKFSRFSPGTISFDRMAEVAELLETINHHMKVHFSCEEHGLFPVLSKYHPMDLMEIEHESIIELKRLLDEGVQRSPESLENLQAISRQFIRELQDHIGREDFGIFPMAERDLSATEKETVVAKMDQIRAQAVSLPDLAVPERHFKWAQCDLTRIPEKAVTLETLLKDEEVMVKEIILKPGAALPSHRTMLPVALVCLKGEAHFIANGEKVVLQPGGVFVLDKRLLHSVEAVSLCYLCVIQWKNTSNMPEND